MKRLILALIACAISVAAEAEDLYFIPIQSEHEAAILREIGAKPVLRANNSYLVLADLEQAGRLEAALPEAQNLASGITINDLGVDTRPERVSSDIYPLLFERDNIRVYRIDQGAVMDKDASRAVKRLPDRNLKVFYKEPTLPNPASTSPVDTIGLDSLIGLVSQDSLESYLYRLEAFYRRLTGTDSCYAAADWIASKFRDFGYDSVVIDTFVGSQLWDRIPVESRNVIATKVGWRYPDRQIIVGAHFDAVPDCPGADDNGSGTAGVMEIARVLKDIETEMTFIFITFDSEESWMWGSYDYADSVAAIGKDIIYMQNLDMIGHLPNSDNANLYNGTEDAYSQLWSDLAGPLVGIQGILRGQTASDHKPFLDNGYDATFVQEYAFSSHYHQSSDSTTYINFEYMTRMVQASLATDYVVGLMMPPIKFSGIYDVGDGQSLMLEWLPGDPDVVDHYLIHYGPYHSPPAASVVVPVDSTRYTISGLTEGTLYVFHITPFTGTGETSIVSKSISGTPYSLPARPRSLKALPQVGSVRLGWVANNSELDFSHYQVIRDHQLLPYQISGNTYIDDDPALGNDFHSYFVVAVDTDGNLSDTTGVAPVISKAATLEAGRVLALNRTGSNPVAWVDESLSGEVMRDALAEFNYTYMSDTSSSNPDRASLYNLIDYELVIVSAEGGRQDDILSSDLLDDICDYLSMGGKAVIFGRWGNIAIFPDSFTTISYTPGGYGGEYAQYFHLSHRVIPLSYFEPSVAMVHSDFAGAHSLMAEYPDLVWDSAVTVHHTGPYQCTGVPFPDFVQLNSPEPDVIYTYDSNTDDSITEGKPVGWRYRGDDYKYVFFDIPLSFMDRSAAVAALHQAVTDLGLVVSADDDSPALVPKEFELLQNHPNPFNPQTVIEFINPESQSVHVSLEIFNILGQRVRVLVDGDVAPGSHRVVWDGRDENDRPAATGVYFYRLKTETFDAAKKMLLLK